MKPRIIILMIVVVVLGGIGAYQQAQIIQLKETRDDLADQVQSLNQQSATGSRDTKPAGNLSKRPDNKAEARKIARRFIDYSIEMETLDRDQLESPETRKRMMDQMVEMMTLSPRQLGIVIDEIIADQAIDPALKRRLLDFSIRRLSRIDPQSSLALLINSTDLQEAVNRNSPSKSGSLIAHAIGQWSRSNPVAASDWMKGHSSDLDENAMSRAKPALIHGAAECDVRLALSLYDEWQPHSIMIPYLVARKGHTGEQRKQALDALRDWRALRPEPAKTEGAFADSLAKLAFGRDLGYAEFEETTEWLANADLSEEDLRLVTRADYFDMVAYTRPEDAGDWLIWLQQTFPEGHAERRITQFMTDHRTAKQAAEWLNTAPDSPAKREVVRTYANTLRDPAEAEALRRKHGLE